MTNTLRADRHRLLAYFAMAFVISWSSMLLVIRHLPATADEFQQLLPVAALSLMPGPVVAGLAFTTDFRQLRERLLRWRAGARWYAVAILTAPLAMAIVMLAMDLTPPIFTARNKGPLLLTAIGAALLGATLEEIGWTGFAVPRLLKRHSVIATGVIVGVIWGAWHFLVNFWASGGLAAGVPLSAFVPLYFAGGVAQLTAYRILMVWVFERTDSLLLAIVMHGSLIVSTVQTVFTPAATGAAFLAWFIATAAALWVVVGALPGAATLRSRSDRQPWSHPARPMPR